MGDSIFERIHFLVRYLNECTIAYDEGNPKISDEEWDNKYFELKQLEEETGLILGDSPTQIINYEVVNALKKVEHNHKMLSLDKTKSLDDVMNFLGHEPFLMMLKMDGLTCSLTYEKGKLVSAETRGNGIIGEDILHNANVIPSIPLSIPTEETVVIDGEIVCKRDDFAQFANDYKNPRNFAAGSIRLLDAKECASRHLTFVAWEVIQGLKHQHCLSDRLWQIQHWGFTTVMRIFRTTNIKRLMEADIKALTEVAKSDGWPIDGVVFKFDDIKYGRSLGETDHHFKNAIAYKFYDETYTTKLLNIEWTMGRTGVLTPVAIFEPVDIDGSTVERASLHNLSIIADIFGPLGPFKYQEVEVFKANMIIPQIKSANENCCKYEEYSLPCPNECPICGGRVEVCAPVDSLVLMCMNPACGGKLINKLDHFCGKKGLDIKGLSKATLEKLINWGWVNDFADIFTLESHKNEWIKKTGFGVKSVDNILNAIQNSQVCDLDKFIASLGIPLIGSTASKELSKTFKTWDAFQAAVRNDKYTFSSLPNFGNEMDAALKHFDYSVANYLVDNCIAFNVNTDNNNVIPTQTLEGKTFVITGKLQYYKNRDALIEVIESHGGKVASSVSKNTTYLINNDKNSTSAKNKSAQSLGIPVLNEEDFLRLTNESVD